MGGLPAMLRAAPLGRRASASFSKQLKIPALAPTTLRATSLQAVKLTVLILKLNQTCGKCVVRHSFDAGYVGLRTVNRALRAHSDSALCKEADASLGSGLIVPQFFGDSCQSSRGVLRLFRK
jgi:hypothetical protein